jgi:hypothetical protein
MPTVLRSWRYDGINETSFSVYINLESINISGESQCVAVHYSDVNMSNHPNQMSTVLADNELAVSYVSRQGQTISSAFY